MAEFFQIGGSIDYLEIEELLLKRYANIEYIMQKEILDGVEFIGKALEKNLDEKIYRQWLVHLPNMTKDTYMSFEDYKNTVLGKNIDNRPDYIIDAELEEIERKFSKGGD